jgi:Uma2 family endonuclease
MTVAKVKPQKPATIVLRPPVHYPESDGMPMAETDAHYRQMTGLRFALEVYFRDAPDVYVGANLLLYYEEGDPHQVVAPDVFVVRDVPKGDRRIYKVWEEGKAPDVVFELTSASTRKTDLGPKKGTYEVLGVQEYFLFDPLEEYLEPPLQGYRLEEKGYRWMEGEPLTSEVLGLELRVEEGQLRLYERETEQRLPTPDEVAEAHRQAEARVQALEDELARLRTELARLRDPS